MAKAYGENSGEFPTISLCMIAKNEEKWLRMAIDSVRPIIDEIILVDTGSTDNTIALAEELGVKVFHRPWDDDFSPPRNLSIEKATGDWIFILDADEAIAERDLAELQRLTLDDRVCTEFLQRHYSNDHRLSQYEACRGEYPEWEKDLGGYFTSNLCRLFPNHQGIHYRGRVHELVEHSIRDINQHRIVRTRIPIHHYGHIDKVKKRKQKSRLYTPLGEEKLHDDPNHWQAHFEMGVEYNQSRRHVESVEAFKKSLELLPTYVPTWVNMGYVLCEMERYREAAAALQQAIRLEPDSYEAHCNLGVVFLRANRLEHAERALRQAIKIKPDYINALCNLGKALALMERYSEAALTYKRAVEYLPNCSTALADLGGVYLSQRMFEQAEGYLIRAIEHEPDLARAYYQLGEIYKVTRNVDRAIEALERYCELEMSQSNGSVPAQTAALIERAKRDCEAMRKLQDAVPKAPQPSPISQLTIDF